ncbi:unnamed protein product [Phaedon cochleariae]|uniref:Cilia- and flagella-associated protein 91 n=1 Tax=Phaedon cochleariae TaxID=80249 RepID=A0A9P0GJ03_PHACE|nr:unnamed protein product [Phaedon cochleariae]
MATSNCFPYRPHDYMYDPIFTVSGPIDHYKAAMVAKMSAVKFQICPIFPNMFSDLPNHPRVQLVPRRSPPPAPYRGSRGRPGAADPALRRPPDVLGADRLKFFCPVLNLPAKEELPLQHHVTFTIEKVAKKVKSNVEAKTRDVSTETKFRESSAQTEPWEPPYKIIGKGDPEILKLDFLKWGSGLPAGMHEVRLIERARMKSAWEKAIQPSIEDAHSLVQFRDYQEALERDEWAFREEEIKEVQELRLKLLEEMLNELHEKARTRTELKMKSFIEKKEKEKKEQMEKIRQKTARELRKLEAQRKGAQTRYKEPNIVDEHVDKKSEIYGPLRRHGEHPKRWHQVIDEKMKKYKAQFIGVEKFSTLPIWLDQATKIDKRRLYSNSPGRRLCIRETKWSAPVLKQLHEELKDLRKETKKRPLSLRTKIETAVEEANTPEVEGVPQLEEDKYQAAVLLQKVIRGRAAQMMIYEGRNTCKELIHELKYSVGLLKKQKEVKSKQKQKVKVQQREECKQLNMVHRLQGSLGKLQGSVVGTLLDFLNKELRRLLEERKAHAMCLMNERERYIREAAEAGRRQKELRRRREHDEMFKQVVKVTQESVDVYLQEIITDGIEFASSEEAKEYIDKLAKKIELETEMDYNKHLDAPMHVQDETIADMVLHFMLPDVEKQLIREKITMKQKQNLKTIHDSIYSEFENLPKIERPPEIVSHILEDIQEKALTDTESGKIAYDILEDILIKVETGISASETLNDIEEAETLSPIHYQDPYEEYLRQLMADEQIDEHEYTSVEEFSDNSTEFQFRHDILDTITEVDTENTESSSNKEQ